MHKIKTKTHNFETQFIKPIIDIGEDSCVINCSENLLTITCKGQGVLYTTSYVCECDFVGKINIASLNKVKTACSLCGEDLEIEVHNNYLIFQMEKAKYKVFMLGDDMVKGKTFDASKLNGFNFPHKFTLGYSDLLELRKYSKLADKDSKVYFYDRDERTYVNLTDEKKSNSNSIEIALPVKIGLKYTTILDKSFLTMIALGTNDLLEISIEENNRLVIVETGGRKYILSTIQEKT